MAVALFDTLNLPTSVDEVLDNRFDNVFHRLDIEERHRSNILSCRGADGVGAGEVVGEQRDRSDTLAVHPEWSNTGYCHVEKVHDYNAVQIHTVDGVG